MNRYIVGSYFLFQDCVYKVTMGTIKYDPNVIQVEELNSTKYIGNFSLTSYVDKNSYELGNNEELIRALYV